MVMRSKHPTNPIFPCDLSDGTIGLWANRLQWRGKEEAAVLNSPGAMHKPGIGGVYLDEDSVGALPAG